MNPKERFQDNPNGVISDSREDLLWLPKDAYGDLGRWVNWQEAQMYLGTMRQVYAGGFNDWRLPTAEEARSLYIPELHCLDWEGEALHIHPAFVPKAGYYIWTSEVNDQGEALRINLRDGTEEFVDKTTRELQSARGVRKA